MRVLLLSVDPNSARRYIYRVRVPVPVVRNVAMYVVPGIVIGSLSVLVVMVIALDGLLGDVYRALVRRR